MLQKFKTMNPKDRFYFLLTVGWSIGLYTIGFLYMPKC
jgi:hypothetical protein